MMPANQLTAIEVLKAIEQNPRITPQEISVKIKINPQQVRNVLSVLVELKLVETPVRGVYLISEKGKHVLNH
jgi:predicted transcriptional regulator